MPVVEKAAALLEAITPAELAAMPPARRRRFADLCRHVAGLAEPRTDTPKAGVLAEIRAGTPRHE
jgi:hypothetical protein